MKSLMGIVTASGFLAGLGIAVLGSTAHAAAYHQLPGIVCQPTDPTAAHSYPASSTGAWLESTLSSIFICHLPDETMRQLVAVDAIYVDVDDGNANPNQHVSIRACAMRQDVGYGGGCGFSGPFANSNFDPITLAPNNNYVGWTRLHAKLTDENGNPLFEQLLPPLYLDVGYLRVDVPQGTTSANRIKSITLSWN